MSYHQPGWKVNISYKSWFSNDRVLARNMPIPKLKDANRIWDNCRFLKQWEVEFVMQLEGALIFLLIRLLLMNVKIWYQEIEKFRIFIFSVLPTWNTSAMNQLVKYLSSCQIKVNTLRRMFIDGRSFWYLPKLTNIKKLSAVTVS